MCSSSTRSDSVGNDSGLIGPDKFFSSLSAAIAHVDPTNKYIKDSDGMAGYSSYSAVHG